jgi:DNA processing protein
VTGVSPPSSTADALDRLRLARSHGVGPRTFIKLLTRFDTAAEALGALPAIAAQSRRAVRIPDITEIEAEIAAAKAAGARLLCLGEPAYPLGLAEIADPPPCLWARGDPAIAARSCVAIVGARNASAAGRRFAATLARELGAAGWAVVSGLARGIDRAAHEAALETGTVAAMAGGVDIPYPPEHAALAADLAERGLLLSAARMGEAPVARSFPKRNRIISGLSAGVVLVEAAERSGSLITARFALEQGREVMAAPGSPLEARAAGCNALIRDGAALIRNAEDVIEALGSPRARTLRRSTRALWEADAPVDETPPDAEPAAPRADGAAQDAPSRVAALLGPTPVSFDDLCRAAALSAPALSAALLELDLDGRIERRPGDMIALKPV